MFNRFCALLLIILLLPLFIILSIFIFFEDGFPIFFTQKRIGIYSKPFKIYKFRSMKKNTPNIASHLLLNPNNYLLKTGKIMRKTSLDELPNLFNILLGDMTFIGPRPALYNQYDLIKLRSMEGIDKILPGLTGWAQVNGRDDISIELKVYYDKIYVDNKTIFLKFKILILTIINILNRKGIAH